MHLQHLPNEPRIEAGFPVEQVYNVDGKTLRVDIDWSVIVLFAGTHAGNPDVVRQALGTHHQSIERVIKARLFAQGFPMNDELVLTPADFGAGQQQ